MIRHFEEELKHVKAKLLEMGRLVESMIDRAVRAVLEQKVQLKEDVIRHEEEVNRLQIELDEMCIALIALQQPAAADLRFITSAMKINSDLERIGDQAINVIDHSAEAAASVPEAVRNVIARMAERVKKMVCDSLDAFVTKDLKLAKTVLERDDEVDNAKDEVFGLLTECMKGDPAAIGSSLDLLIISRNLERIGDHATNIAEDVIYMVAGKDIRHHILENR